MQVATKFISIYEIENGLELTGLYFLMETAVTDTSSKELLKGK